MEVTREALIRCLAGAKMGIARSRLSAVYQGYAFKQVAAEGVFEGEI